MQPVSLNSSILLNDKSDKVELDTLNEGDAFKMKTGAILIIASIYSVDGNPNYKCFSISDSAVYDMDKDEKVLPVDLEIAVKNKF